MNRKLLLPAFLAPLALGLAGPAGAQSVSITPLAGAFHPSNGFADIRGGDGESFIRNRPFALGVNVEAGFLRGSIAYATGARIVGDGIGDSDRLGEGSLLAVTGDVVIRPLPRLFGFQPYALAGVGFKRDHYSFDDESIADPLPEENRDLAWHIGAGAELMLGRVGLVAEISDFVTARDNHGLGRHDSFFMMGLKIRLF